MRPYLVPGAAFRSAKGGGKNHVWVYVTRIVKCVCLPHAELLHVFITAVGALKTHHWLLVGYQMISHGE